MSIFLPVHMVNAIILLWLHASCVSICHLSSSRAFSSRQSTRGDKARSKERGRRPVHLVECLISRLVRWHFLLCFFFYLRTDAHVSPACVAAAAAAASGSTSSSCLTWKSMRKVCKVLTFIRCQCQLWKHHQRRHLPEEKRLFLRSNSSLITRTGKYHWQLQVTLFFSTSSLLKQSTWEAR